MNKLIFAIALLLVLIMVAYFFVTIKKGGDAGKDISRLIGISWESINGPPGGRVAALIQNSYKHNELYALTQRGIYKSEDKGESWRLMNGSEDKWVNSIAAYKDRLFVCADGVSYYDSNENLVKVYDGWCERLAISGDKLFVATAGRKREELQIFYSDLKSGNFDWHDISPSASELRDITLPSADTGFDCIIKVPHIVTVGDRILANIMVEMGGGSGECSNGQLYKSEDLGNMWSKVELNKPDELVISNIVRDPNDEKHVIVTLKHRLHDSYLPLYMFLRESYDGGLTWSPVTNITNLEVNFVGDVDITESSYYITLPKGGQFLKLNKLNRSDYGLIDQPRAEGYDKELIFSLQELLFDLDDLDIVYGRTNDMWAYGLVKSEDGMKTWKKMDRDIVASSPSIVIVHPTNPNIIFTTGNTAHEAYFTKDGGTTWMPFSRIAFGDELKIDPHNANHLILIDENTALFESYNLGKNFSGININAGGNSSFSSAKVFDFEIAKDDPNKIYASNMGLGISKSNLSQQGEHWSYLLSSPDYVYSMKLDPGDSNILYASYSPKIFENYASVWRYSKYQEKNSGWSEILRVENSRGITSLEFDESNPDNIYAGVIGKEGTIYSSHDRGKTWSKLNEDLTFTTIWGHSQLQIDPRDKNTVYAGTWGGGTYKTINGGKDWILLDENHTFSPTCLAISEKNPNVMYACDRTSPKIHKSTDAGKSWTEYYDFGKDYMLTSAVAIDPDDPDTIYASAFKPPMAHLGGLVKITNGQATPIGKDLPRSVIEIEIDPKNRNTIYATTHIHGVYKSSDGGNNWEELDDKSNGLPRIGVYDIDVDPKNSEILYATALCGPVPDYMMPPQAVQLLTGFKNLDPNGKCGVYKSVDGGKNWSLILATMSEARGIDIDPKNPNNLYVADMMGGVWVSNDAGENWRQENNGLGSISMTSVKIKDDYIYASTQGSGVYSGVINRDGSITWDGSRSNKPKAYVYKIQIEVDPTNSKRIYASAYPGGLLRSDDGGKNWNDKNFLTPSIRVDDPVLQGYYSFDIDPKNTSVIWMGVYGKGMLVSYDGMDFDMFADGDNNTMRGKRITSVRINPNTDEVYAGSQEGVFVTKDNGKHWEAMNNGLETLDVRSLKIANITYPPFVDDFEDGKADGWGFFSAEQNVGGWSVVRESGNYVLQGIGHVGAVAGSESWSDYTFESKVKLIEGGIHVNYRAGEGGKRYAIGMYEGSMYLMKSTAPDTHINLVNVELPLGKDWNTVKIVGKGSSIKVYVNNELKIDYTDNEPVLNGGINFESLPDSKVYVDDVNVTIDVVDSAIYAGTAGYGIYRFDPLNKKWQNTGRTLGFGWWNPWDRRMYQFSSLLFDPDVPGRVYLGHFPSGFYISEDDGHSWRDSSVGLGNDGMFSLYMHPQNHSILFGGTYNGIAKSEDGGKIWKLKGKKGIENLKGEEAWKAWENRTEGIMPPEQWPYTVAIDSSNPNIIYTTTKNGKNKGYCQRNMNMLGGYDRNHFCGIVMKSTDGGETWFEIMNGLDWGTEFYTLIIYPKNHSVLFLSNNKGVHISTNAGESWEPINGGLPTPTSPYPNQVRDNVADNLALTPDNRYLILGLTNHGAWRTDLSKLNLSSS